MEEIEQKEEQPAVQTYQEKRASKLAARESVKKSGTRERQTKRFGTYAILLVAVVAVGFGLFRLIQTADPEGEDFSQGFPIQGRDHIEGGSVHPSYSSNPPSSGWHYTQTASVRFYEEGEVVADENLIHNLEHGDIWISYHPRVAQEIKDELREFVGSRVVVALREANDTDIALVAWGRVDTFQIESGILDKLRIEDFIKRYINQGPEKVSPTVHGG